MTDPNFAETLRKLIQDDKTFYNVSHYGSNYDSGTGPEGTSHLSILAANGDAVSLTTTINFRYVSCDLLYSLASQSFLRSSRTTLEEN